MIFRVSTLRLIARAMLAKSGTPTGRGRLSLGAIVEVYIKRCLNCGATYRTSEEDEVFCDSWCASEDEPDYCDKPCQHPYCLLG